MKKNLSHTDNNFNFLRLFFATLVIFSHSFSLTNSPEPLYTFSGFRTFGELAVEAFFIMSGYLIFNSLKNSKSIISYLWKRCLRIFPGLFVMLMITILIIAFIFPETIFTEEFITYLPNCLSLYLVQYEIGNVFSENPYPKAINGSLWSLSYEFSMYLMMILFYFFRKNKNVAYLISVFFIVCFSFSIFNPNFLQKYFSMIHLESKLIFRLSPFFLAGVLLSFVKLEVLKNIYLQIIIIVILILSLKFSFYKESAPLILSILILPFATSYNKFLQIPDWFGDISYGVYIYGFFIQQLLMYFFNLDAITLFFAASLITYVLSFFSWRLIEKPALKLKNYF